MKKQLTLIILLFPFFLVAQPFAIGHRTLVYNDPSRSGGYGSGGGPGRQIQCEVYYPASVAGNDVPCASTVSPLIVLGHGFFMGYDAYQNLWESLVPNGYIVILPRTEGSISPVHSDFAKDLIVVNDRFAVDAANSSNVYFGIWNGKSAVMGHSMGGGATFLAAGDSSANFTVAVGLAPAETTPSAIAAAQNCTIPSLILSGSQDMVTPPSSNHELIYQAIPNSVCKQYVSILGGGHCYFANANSACDFGELTSGGNMTISRTEQHEITDAVLIPFLDFHLKQNCESWNNYLLELTTDSRIQALNNCNYQGIPPVSISQNSNWLVATAALNYQWYLNGQPIAGETNDSLDCAIYGIGAYFVETIDSTCFEQSNTLLVTILSVSSVHDEGISCYPNPTSGLVNIANHTAQMMEMELFDAMGQIVIEFEVSDSFILDLKNYAPGVYTLRTANAQLFRIIKIQ